MKLSIQFENYKKLRDMQATMDGSNVYLVQGGNEKGKTTFINGLLTLLTAKNITQTPVSTGEDKGNIVLSMDYLGEQIKVVFEFTDEKNKFTLISGSRVITKVTDIRAFLDYKDLSSDEFLSWSNTAEGRRKQRDIVLELLGSDIKDEFIKLDEEEKAIYYERSEINNKVKALKAITSDLTEVDMGYDGANLKRSESLAENRSKLDALKKEKETKVLDNLVTQDANNTLYDIIASAKHFGEICVHEDFGCATIKTANGLLQDEHDTEEIQVNIYKCMDLISELEKADDKKTENRKNYALFSDARDESNALTSKLDAIRKSKNDIIKNAKFPIPEIEIGEDGLYVQTSEGKFQFDSKQISTSISMLITAKILLLLNKHLPVIVIGRAESFDRDSLNNLHEFAIANDCIMVMDRVIENNTDVEVIGYEQLR